MKIQTVLNADASELEGLSEEPWETLEEDR